MPFLSFANKIYLIYWAAFEEGRDRSGEFRALTSASKKLGPAPCADRAEAHPEADRGGGDEEGSRGRKA